MFPMSTKLSQKFLFIVKDFVNGGLNGEMHRSKIRVNRVVMQNANTVRLHRQSMQEPHGQGTDEKAAQGAGVT